MEGDRHPATVLSFKVMQALVRTLWMSGAYAAFENMVAIISIFGVHVPLFMYGCAPARCPTYLPMAPC